MIFTPSHREDSSIRRETTTNQGSPQRLLEALNSSCPGRMQGWGQGPSLLLGEGNGRARSSPQWNGRRIGSLGLALARRLHFLHVLSHSWKKPTSLRGCPSSKSKERIKLGRWRAYPLPATKCPLLYTVDSLDTCL